MKAWKLMLVLACGLPVLLAQSEDHRVRLSRPAVRAELVSAVKGQLAAFRAEDWAKAYEFASRSFQSVVRRPQFVTLITRNYPVVWKNTRAEFGVPSDNGVVAVVPVRVFSARDSAAYDWLMVKEGERWRVTGVVPHRTDNGA